MKRSIRAFQWSCEDGSLKDRALNLIYNQAGISDERVIKPAKLVKDSLSLTLPDEFITILGNAVILSQWTKTTLDHCSCF